MLKLTVNSTLEKAYDFIDNRLVLHMAQKKLRVTGSMGKVFIINKRKIKQNVQDTIFYLEKEPKRGTLVIIPNEKKDGKVVSYPCGMSLRVKTPSEFELYLDTLNEAIKKGILTKEQLGSKLKIIMIVLAIVAILSAFVLFPLFVVCVVILIIGYPIVYIIEKRKFKHIQDIMSTLVSIFEAEFPSSGKQDSKDWINFWMRVKSDAKELLIP